SSSGGLGHGQFGPGRGIEGRLQCTGVELQRLSALEHPPETTGSLRQRAKRLDARLAISFDLHLQDHLKLSRQVSRVFGSCGEVPFKALSNPPTPVFEEDHMEDVRTRHN